MVYSNRFFDIIYDFDKKVYRLELKPDAQKEMKIDEFELCLGCFEAAHRDIF